MTVSAASFQIDRLHVVLADIEAYMAGLGSGDRPE